MNPVSDYPLELGLNEFASLFGCAIEEIPPDCKEIIGQNDFHYRVAEGSEQDEILQGVLKNLDTTTLTVSGAQRLPDWEKGWGENLEAFSKSKNILELVPKYIRPGRPLRLFQKYIVTRDPHFEFNWYMVFRRWLFRTYFKEARVICEFGCGSGFNLPVLSQLYPDKKIIGLDWTAASVDIVNRMTDFGWNIEGRRFDFFKPDKNFVIGPQSAVVTIGALEQTGQKYGDFLNYLVDSKPAICAHVEPVVEWYDEKDPIDQAAIRFHKKRGYWEGFIEQLRDFERKGHVQILKTKRSYLGSLCVEGYSQIIWKSTEVTKGLGK